jgi:hypothetical protein
MNTLDRLCLLFNSVRGTDKAFMLIQYSSKLIIHQLQKTKNKDLVCKIQNLVGPISDFRILLRYYALLPLFQYIISTEENPHPNRRIRLLTRLENAANAIYYPLEHTYWLALHNVISMDEKTRDKIGRWSCRCWCLQLT